MFLFVGVDVVSGAVVSGVFRWVLLIGTMVTLEDCETKFGCAFASLVCVAPVRFLNEGNSVEYDHVCRSGGIYMSFWTCLT